MKEKKVWVGGMGGWGGEEWKDMKGKKKGTIDVHKEEQSTQMFLHGDHT